jgi:hypothetical protein
VELLVNQKLTSLKMSLKIRVPIGTMLELMEKTTTVKEDGGQ